jgi:hypothetical protein
MLEEGETNKQSGCWGCNERQPNQLAHMDPGGCLYQPEISGPCYTCGREIYGSDWDWTGHCSRACARKSQKRYG